MPKHHFLEEEKKNKPPILLIDTNSGIKNTLLNLLVSQLSSQGKIYALSSKELPANVEKISPLSVHLLDRLSDNLKYSVVFLDEESQKKKVLSIIEKLSVYKTRIVLVIPYRVIERFVDILLRVKDEDRVVVGMLGDLFGKESAQSPLSKIVKNAIVNKEVLLSGNELFSIYPISDSDAVTGIQYLLFGTKDTSSFYNLFYPHPETLVSLSHLLKRHEPELSVQFKDVDIGLKPEKTQQEKDTYIYSRTTVKPQFLSSVLSGFEKGVVEFESGIKDISLPGKKKVKIFSKPTKLSKIVKGIRYLIVAFILYVVLTFALFFTGILFFSQGVSQLMAGNTTNAKTLLQTSGKLEAFTKNTVFLFSSLPSRFTEGKLEENLRAYDDLVSVAQDTIPAITKIKTNNPTLSKKDLENVASSVLRLYFIAERNNAPQLKSLVSSRQFKNSAAFLPLLPILPSVLGYDSEKTYLILFQNDSELRPTGGFIGSVGLMHVKSGKITSLNIQDVYDLDGQLKGHIEPYYIIRRYLQPHLYLRDSNFAPEFAETASTAAFIYNAESGNKVDAVLSIDTQVLKAILKATGPIKIEGAGTVNSENVVSLLTSNIQDNFFPGSTNKKDTLTTLFNKITLHLQKDNLSRCAAGFLNR